MERILEPELMDDEDQAEAYAHADFEEPHSRIIELFEAKFPHTEIEGPILDLGCGPGDVTFRFARCFPGAPIDAIDGSAAMIRLANSRKADENATGKNITFIESLIPGNAIPREKYSLIVSTSFLHHLHDPSVLWKTILKHAECGTKIFVCDLFRPKSSEVALRIVNQYSGSEPEVMKRDFYNSLLAAFEPDEVEQQLSAAGLSELTVKMVSDRHVIIFGERG
jgi:trans-aconitate methyltransferase